MEMGPLRSKRDRTYSRIRHDVFGNYYHNAAVLGIRRRKLERVGRLTDDSRRLGDAYNRPSPEVCVLRHSVHVSVIQDFHRAYRSTFNRLCSHLFIAKGIENP
jgi:hypothetical protein